MDMLQEINVVRRILSASMTTDVNQEMDIYRDKVKIFIHIPKTAGTSMNYVIDRNFTDDQIISTSSEKAVQLRDLDDEIVSKIEFVRGHITYGIDRFIPKESKYLCLFRLPGPRIFSFYNFVCRSTTHRLHTSFNKSGFDFGHFLEFAYSDAGLLAEIHNGQIRRIADRMGNSLGKEQEVLHEAARIIVEEKILYGFSERFDQFVAELHRLGILFKYMPAWENKAPAGECYETAVSNLNKHQKKLFHEFTVWDGIFYEACYKEKYGEI